MYLFDIGMMEKEGIDCDQIENVGELSWRKGPWTVKEDSLLTEYVKLHGEGRWNSVSSKISAGLNRSGKTCRLRWVNYLRPDLKKDPITPEEETLILQLHTQWGNRWSTIARSLPGRTDNEIKNCWRTRFKKSGKASKTEGEAKSRGLMRLQQEDAAAELQKMLYSMEMDQEVAAPSETNFELAPVSQIGDLDNCICNGDLGLLWDGSMEEESLMWNELWDFEDINIWATNQDFFQYQR